MRGRGTKMFFWKNRNKKHFTVRFPEESREVCTNPGRGWYHIYTFTLDKREKDGLLYQPYWDDETLVLVRFDIGAFRGMSLSEEALEYADENYGVKNPMHKIPALGSRSRSVDTIKKHQIKQLQDTLKESSMLEQVIVLSLLNSGVRRGELAGLTWKDVNFEECTIHISKSLLVFKNYGYQLTTTKESNIRDVDVAPEYMDFLKEYYKYWKSQKKLMGGSWQKSLDKKSSKYAPSLLALRGTDFVICNDHGFPINPDSYGALVRRIGQRAGIEGLHPHMFRHTFVSILLSNPEIGVATVAAEAGHAQPSTTLAIYTQVYDKRRKEIRNQMSKELYE